MIRLVFHAPLEADEFLLLKHAFDMRHDHLKSDPETSCDSNLKSCQASHLLDFSHLTRRSETWLWNWLRQSRHGVRYCVPLCISTDSHLINPCSCEGIAASLYFCWVHYPFDFILKSLTEPKIMVERILWFSWKGYSFCNVFQASPWFCSQHGGILLYRDLGEVKKKKVDRI